MTIWLVRFRELIVPLLQALAAMLAFALVVLILVHGIDEWRWMRRRRLVARYQPLVDALLAPTPPPDVLEALLRSPHRHSHVIADLMIATLRLTAGDIVPRLRNAAQALGFVERWRRMLGDRRWWRRSEGVRAIGLVRDGAFTDALLAALDDSHEEVRAAAVDALGRIADLRAVPGLLARLHDASRHQHARLIEALRAHGPGIVPTLLEHVQQQPGDRALVANILGVVGGMSAIEPLLDWTGVEDPDVRAAAVRALGSTGLDDRSFFYALRALNDPDVDVRAMAARALGRSGRRSAVPYLAEHLDDAWLVAAHCATGLRRLGQDGMTALQSRAELSGQAGDLARQMLWELTFLKASA